MDSRHPIRNLDQVKLGAIHTTTTNQQFVYVDAIGDGNCALNAFALGLIHAIQTGAYNDRDAIRFLLENMRERQNLFILEERLKLYQCKSSSVEGNSYTDLVEPLSFIVENLQTAPKKPLSNDDEIVNLFIRYIKSAKSQQTIAALSVALAPALRAMGNKAYRDQTREIDGLEEDNDLDLDGVHTGYITVLGLSNLLNISVEYYHLVTTTVEASNITECIRQDGNHVPQARGTIHLLHNAIHWGLFIPATETKGLMQSLPAVAPRAPQVHSDADALDEGDFARYLQTAAAKHETKKNINSTKASSTTKAVPVNGNKQKASETKNLETKKTTSAPTTPSAPKVVVTNEAKHKVNLASNSIATDLQFIDRLNAQPTIEKASLTQAATLLDKVNSQLENESAAVINQTAVSTHALVITLSTKMPFIQATVDLETNKLAKDLLAEMSKTPVLDLKDAHPDEAYARALQNAELVSFFARLAPDSLQGSQQRESQIPVNIRHRK